MIRSVCSIFDWVWLVCWEDWAALLLLVMWAVYKVCDWNLGSLASLELLCRKVSTLFAYCKYILLWLLFDLKKVHYSHSQTRHYYQDTRRLGHYSDIYTLKFPKRIDKYNLQHLHRIFVQYLSQQHSCFMVGCTESNRYCSSKYDHYHSRIHISRSCILNYMYESDNFYIFGLSVSVGLNKDTVLLQAAGAA